MAAFSCSPLKAAIAAAHKSPSVSALLFRRRKGGADVEASFNAISSHMLACKAASAVASGFAAAQSSAPWRSSSRRALAKDSSAAAACVAAARFASASSSARASSSSMARENHSSPVSDRCEAKLPLVRDDERRSNCAECAVMEAMRMLVSSSYHASSSSSLSVKTRA